MKRYLIPLNRIFMSQVLVVGSTCFEWKQCSCENTWKNLFYKLAFSRNSCQCYFFALSFSSAFIFLEGSVFNLTMFTFWNDHFLYEIPWNKKLEAADDDTYVILKLSFFTFNSNSLNFLFCSFNIKMYV